MSTSIKPVMDHVSDLHEELQIDPLSRDFFFRRKYAERRNQPYPEDIDRTWLNALARDAMTAQHRSEIFPGRFDLGNGRTSGPFSIRALMDEINGVSQAQRKPALKGERLAKKTPGDLVTVLTGIQKITGRDLSDRSGLYSSTDLKVIKLLYEITKERKSHLFDFVERPRTPETHTLEFRTISPDPRNKEGTLLISDMLTYFSLEISDDRLARIDRSLPSLPERLLSMEKLNIELSKTLSLRFKGNSQAKIEAFNRLAEAISRYEPIQEASDNPLDEAIYTHLRSLQLVHFAGGYADILKEKARLRLKVPSIEDEFSALHDAIELRTGQYVLPLSPVVSLETFQEFSLGNSRQLISVIEKVIGQKTDRRKFKGLLEPAKRILHLYYHFHLGERNLGVTWLTPMDCIAALCTIRDLQVNPVDHKPYWHGQGAQGENILRHLETERSIDELIKEDFVPHGINQIILHRWHGMYAALMNSSEYYQAWVTFQAARLQKYTECLRSNDIDAIHKSLLHYHMQCLSLATTCEAPSAQNQPSMVDAIRHWMYREEAS